MEEGGWAYPDITWTEIALTLQAPPTKILGGDDGGKMVLFMRRAWASPLTMILPLDPWLQDKPSRAVGLARMHLEAAFQEAGPTFLKFESLGPSPAHVDLFLHPEPKCEKEPDSQFALRRYSRPSYHRYELAFEPTDFDSAEAVALAYFAEATSALDFHYQCFSIRARHILGWNALADNIERIKTVQEKGGLVGTYRRLVNQRQPVNQAAIDLADLELDFLSASKEVNARDIFGPGKPGHFKELVKESRDELSPLPTEQFLRLISLFESRRVTDRDLLATLLFGLLAAAVGAAATLIAST